MVVGTVVLALLGYGLHFVCPWPWAWVIFVPVEIWLLAFFRDPERAIPGTVSDYLSPADGVVSDIREVPDCDVLGEPAIRIGIFLSVFNVHINRAPCEGVIKSVQYRKGKFINALHHDEASNKNEANTIVIADSAGRCVAGVRQLVGLIARRIVCDAKVGDKVDRGQRYGMIKFGSRTELYIPSRLKPTVKVQVGQKVCGAAVILASVEG